MQWPTRTVREVFQDRRTGVVVVVVVVVVTTNVRILIINVTVVAIPNVVTIFKTDQMLID